MPRSDLPGHIEESARAIVDLHREEQKKASLSQHAIERVVDTIGRPAFIACLLAFLNVWIAANLLLRSAGMSMIDGPPLPILTLLVSLLALAFMILILTRQNRDDDLAWHREALALQLAILSDRKLSKIVKLLEERRRDNPLLDDRSDKVAEALAEPADPQSLTAAIRQHRQS